MKILFVLLLFVFLPSTYNHQYNCVFDSINQDLTAQSSKAKPDEGYNMNRQGRILLTITRNPIRITLDTTAFNTIIAGVNGAATTTQSNLNFILRVLAIAQNFYMNRLKVYPVTKIFSPSLCVDVTTTTNDRINGISGSDLHIYASYLTDKNTAYGATGKSCKYFGDLLSTLPDATLQAGRPTVGRIKFNTYTLVDGQSLTNRLFQSVTSTALHEILHILGFDSTLYQYYLDSSTGLAYTNPVITASPTVHSSRPATNLLTTPNVLAWAQDFFSCPTLQGMLLENQDGSGLGSGSHWQRLAMYDELMTATSFGAAKGMSGLSFAMLADMGWYSVDSTFAQTTNYGYHLGCPFLLDACYSATTFSTFCNAATQSSISTCSSNFFSKAICSNQAGLLADGCGMYGPYFNCVDPDSSNDGYQSYTLEVYSTNSFCVTGTLGNVPLPGTVLSRCYPYVCGTSSITFTIGSNTVVCLSNEAGTQKTINSFTGYITCPNFNDFCTLSRKTCSKWCSQNGYCTDGVCNCYTGYSGADCSQTICTVNGTYYNQATNSCVTTCPSRTFQNAYSRSCQACVGCQQCFGTPTTCTGCVSTIANPQYFYSGSCYSACPLGTYQSGFNCVTCDVSVNCKSCSISSTNCTGCLNGLFLNNPTWGTCTSTCSGTFSLYDTINYLCTSSCSYNLVLSGSTCVMCSGNTYKDVNSSTCVSNCSNRYYPDTTLHLCAQCDSSCLTCDGPNAENCLSCQSSSSLKYLLLQMCWSVCPKGTYANDTSGQCQVCTIGLYCDSCVLRANGTVQCVTCSYGYYYLNNACIPQCPTGMYNNNWNHSCGYCNSSCVTCTGPDSSSCISCNTASFKILTNVTGGYCLIGCPAVGYFTSGVNCLSCDTTCYTCSGIGTNQCTSCQTGLFLNLVTLSAGYCRYVCPQTTYPDTTTKKCLGCDQSCTFCFGSTINNCTACISEMVLYNFTCTTKCPTGLTVNQWKVCFESFYGMGILLLVVLLS